MNPKSNVKGNKEYTEKEEEDLDAINRRIMKIEKENDSRRKNWKTGSRIP